MKPFLLAILCCCFVRGDGLRKRFRRDTVRAWNRKWPNAQVPYIFAQNADYSTRNAFQNAIKEIERVSCVRFIPRTTQRDYVKVVTGDGCYSLVGKDGLEQELSLGAGCHRFGIVLHEVMHLLGFFHEQSRVDRDHHVQINMNNVKDDLKRQFRKYNWQDADTLGEPYDPDSIMHYSNHAFSKNGLQTIIYRQDPRKRLGQRDKLSSTDIKQLNKLYQCPYSYLRRVGVTNEHGENTVEETVNNRVARKGSTNSILRKCRDDYWATLTGECLYAVYMGHCYSRYDRMVVTCPHSCGFCSRPTCLDKSQYCDYFYAIGYCRTSGTVKKRCKRTCGLC